MFWHIVLIIVQALLAVFILCSVIAIIKKSSSIYKNHPEQKNPMEGKKVVFVEDDNDPYNADGVRGHLQTIGTSDKRKGFYETVIKRLLDVVLSFCGLVALSPIYLILIVLMHIHLILALNQPLLILDLAPYQVISIFFCFLID